MTEGRCTGIPKIRRALKKNDSPKLIFKTDRDRIYFLTTILIHPKYKIERISEQVGEQVGEQVKKILNYCLNPQKKNDILKHLNLSSVYLNYKRHILPLIEKELIALIIPDKPRRKIKKKSFFILK